MRRVVIVGAFLACIIAANYLTTHYGMVWAFGFTTTAGTYLAGLWVDTAATQSPLFQGVPV